MRQDQLIDSVALEKLKDFKITADNLVRVETLKSEMARAYANFYTWINDAIFSSQSAEEVNLKLSKIKKEILKEINGVLKDE